MAMLFLQVAVAVLVFLASALKLLPEGWTFWGTLFPIALAMIPIGFLHAALGKPGENFFNPHIG